MAASVHMQTTVHDNKRSLSFMATSPLFDLPRSDLRFGSALHGQIETLNEDSNKAVTAQSPLNKLGQSEKGESLNEDSMLLLRGFDSISHTLSQLSNNLDNALQNLGESEKGRRLNENSILLLREFDSISDNLYQLSNNLEHALQGANDVAKQPPTLAELFLRSLRSSEDEDNKRQKKEQKWFPLKGLKRKYDLDACSNNQVDDSHKKKDQSSKEKKNTKRAKNVGLQQIAISMATKATSLARELKSMKSHLNFTQVRHTSLIQDGCDKGMVPEEEDDLVRLQLEALLAEKSRLANENLNLIRDIKSLQQVVHYHRIAIESKSMKSNSSFTQEQRTSLIQEQRTSLIQDGCDKRIVPEEEDLVRLQVEALLAEKSKLANENLNLIRDIKSLQQVVDYHRITRELKSMKSNSSFTYTRAAYLSASRWM